MTASVHLNRKKETKAFGKNWNEWWGKRGVESRTSGYGSSQCDAKAVRRPRASYIETKVTYSKFVKKDRRVQDDIRRVSKTKKWEQSWHCFRVCLTTICLKSGEALSPTYVKKRGRRNKALDSGLRQGNKVHEDARHDGKLQDSGELTTLNSASYMPWRLRLK